MPTLPAHSHVGIIVADIAEARARLSDQLGVQWGPVVDLAEVAYRDGDGRDLELPTRFCYSVGDPCLELIEELPGSVWERNEHSNLHHVGYWSDDLAADSAGLGAAGCPLQLCGRSGDRAPDQFAYHRDPVLGVRVEVVDAGLRELMSFMFLPDPGPG